MKKERKHIIDFIRGITTINMIIFHGIWDFVYILDMEWEWFSSFMAFVWQQVICCTFILLSGFCWSLGQHRLKRGAIVFGMGMIVSITTLIVVPEDRIIFGILTFLGTVMLCMILLEKVLRKVNSYLGLIISLLLFAVTRFIGEGYLGLMNVWTVKIPGQFYEGYLATFLGLTDRQFFSTDYFAFFPWSFLFIEGYFLFRIVKERGWFEKGVFKWSGDNCITKLGRQSLLVYMLHQPLIYVMIQVGLILSNNIIVKAL